MASGAPVGEVFCSTSPCTPIPPPEPNKNQVFLSFRGEDTRNGFAGYLCAALESKKIDAFRDNKDLKRGEVISAELQKAIEGSMIAVIILSPNYASSTWCLYELQHIVACNKERGLSIMPIFYGVEPSDVRHQKGSLEEAFIKHEERFGQDSEDVRSWRHALTQVAGIAGWNSKDKPEAELVEGIAEYIHEKIQKLPSFKKNPGGIASMMKEMTERIGNIVIIEGTWKMVKDRKVRPPEIQLGLEKTKIGAIFGGGWIKKKNLRKI